MLEVRKARELGDVRGGGSRSGIGERQRSGGGETEEGRNCSAKAARLMVESRTKERSGAWRILHAIFSPKDNL